MVHNHAVVREVVREVGHAEAREEDREVGREVGREVDREADLVALVDAGPDVDEVALVGKMLDSRVARDPLEVLAAVLEAVRRVQVGDLLDLVTFHP